MGLPILDLHCDLLSYLAGERGHTPHDPQVHCSIPQLKGGGVRLQVLAIFAETGVDSIQRGLEQADIYKVLAVQHSPDFEAVQIADTLPTLLRGSRVGIVAAFENASGFCGEEEPIQTGLERLKMLFGKVGRPLYVSLTWNHENRFGGGALTGVGLKEDGKKLIELLASKQIAVDLSHASDQLAHDILTFVDSEAIPVSLIASHSNTRAGCDMLRNLPDELLSELFRREGVVGLNFVRAFVGPDPDAFCKHVEHVIKLGGERSLVFGADFFYEQDTPSNTYGKSADGWFFPTFDSSACYGKLLELLRRRLSLSDDVIANIAYRNGVDFITRLWATQKSEPVSLSQQKLSVNC